MKQKKHISLMKEPRRIVRLSKAIVSDIEAEELRQKGIIPIREEEATIHETFRIDTETKQKLRKIQEWYKKQGKKYTKSDLVRLALLDFIKKHEEHGALKS